MTTASDPTTTTTSATEPSSTTEVTTVDDTDPGCPRTKFDIGPLDECSLFAQDCRPCTKCAPSSFSGVSYESTRCVPILGDGERGDPCSVVGDLRSGEDDCAIGHVCWYVDPQTMQGTCVPACTGTSQAPECAVGEACYDQAPLALCLPVCDPLTQECTHQDATCDSLGPPDEFVCHQDKSGSSPPGSPCHTVNQVDGALCDPGATCVDFELYPAAACDLNDGCCAPYCDLFDPQCPADPPGLGCAPWFSDEAPPGLEHVGYCAVL